MVARSGKLLKPSLFGLVLLASCSGDDSARGLALCEQVFRAEGQNLDPAGAGCWFYGTGDTDTFYSDDTSDPDLKAVAAVSPGGLKFTATSHGVTVASAGLSAAQLKTGEKLIVTVNTLDGDTYEFRYWGSRIIDPAEYMDGIDGGWVDGGWTK